MLPINFLWLSFGLSHVFEAVVVCWCVMVGHPCNNVCVVFVYRKQTFLTNQQKRSCVQWRPPGLAYPWRGTCFLVPCHSTHPYQVRPLQFNYLSYELFLEKKSCQTQKKKKKKVIFGVLRTKVVSKFSVINKKSCIFQLFFLFQNGSFPTSWARKTSK